MSKNHIFVLMKMVKWPKRILIFSLILSIVTAALTLYIPLATKNVVDNFALENIDWRIISLLVFLFIGNAILGGISFYLLRYLGEHTILTLRNRIWDHVLKLPISYFDKNETGTTVSRLTDDISTMNAFVAEKIPNVISQFLIVIGAIIFLFILDWQLSLALFLSIPLLFLVIIPIGNLTYSISENVQGEMANFTGLLSRILGEIRLVKTYVGEKKEYDRVSNSTNRLFKLALKEAKIQATVSPIVSSTMIFILICLVGYGGLRLSNGTISPGTFVAIIFYLIQCIVPISSIITFFTEYKKTSGATARLYEIYSLEEEELSTVSFESIGDGQLEIKDLSFSYNGNNEQVLKNISFVVPDNKVTAIVGPSGAGKTTIFNLIERLYETNRGSILYNEEEIHNIPLTNWRKSIGYVMQENSIINGTIEENILYSEGSSVSSNNDKLEYYSKLANAHDFIESFPEGYKTIVGERGIRLSGGQKQRISIARAFTVNPKILLLDEATASLDSESEKQVQEAMYKLMENRTTMVIAHRLSTIRNADQIIFLDEGEVTGVGKHSTLMTTHQKYKNFVETQSLKEEKMLI